MQKHISKLYQWYKSKRIEQNSESSTDNLKRYKKKQSGFNAIELSLVLAVIAVAIVATIRVMGNNSDKQKTAQMVSDVSTFVSNIKNAYSGTATGYGTITDNTPIIQMKAYPSDLRVSGNNILTQFSNGQVNIKGLTLNGIDAFSIEYTNVPTQVCSSVIGTLGSAMFLQILVGTTVVFDQNAGTELDATKVATQCAAGKSAGVNITFVAS